MKLSCKTALCLAGLLAVSPAIAAKVYKWVDENGVVNFSEHPPKNTKTEVINPKIGHSEPVTYQTTDPATTTEAKQIVEAAQQSQKDPERCSAAQNNLRILQDFGRVRVPAEDGSFTYLTEAEQKEKIDLAQEVIKQSC